MQGPYRVLENAGTTFRLRIGAEDVRVSSDRVTPGPRRELPSPTEGNSTPTVPMSIAPGDGNPSPPPIYRPEGRPRRPGKRKVRFAPSTTSEEARRSTTPDWSPTQGEFVVEKLVDFGEAEDGTRLFRVRWLGYEETDDTWEPEDGLPATFIRRYWKNKARIAHQ